MDVREWANLYTVSLEMVLLESKKALSKGFGPTWIYHMGS